VSIANSGYANGIAGRGNSGSGPERVRASVCRWGSAAIMANPAAQHMGWVIDPAMAQQAPFDPNLCAVVVLPAPANSFNIRLGSTTWPRTASIPIHGAVPRAPGTIVVTGEWPSSLDGFLD
jgi:hypothetical protein